MLQVLVLLAISGLIAWLGDRLGTRIGKNRLSVFGLRPRDTAVLITVTTGVLITLLTLGFAAMLSENVQIALFSVDALRQEQRRLGLEVGSLTADVTTLRSERARMASDVASLEERVRIKQRELVVLRKDEMLLATVVPASATLPAIETELASFIRVLSDRARQRGLQVEDSEAFLAQNRAQLDRLVAHIASSPHAMVVAAVAAENINVGESLGQVRFQVRPNSLIFSAGETIASVVVDGNQERSRIARELLGFLDEINHEVVKLGMIGNPLTERLSGDMSSEDMMAFHDMVNRIAALRRPVQVAAVVKRDTTAIGPLEVTFRLGEPEEDEGLPVAVPASGAASAPRDAGHPGLASPPPP